MKKHTPRCIPMFVSDDLATGPLDYAPMRNAVVLQLDGARPRYFARVAAAMRYVKQSHPHAYMEERRCV